MNNQNNNELGNLQDYWRRNQLNHYNMMVDEKVKAAELAGAKKKQRRSSAMPIVLSVLCALTVIGLTVLVGICGIGYTTYKGEMRDEVLGKLGEVPPLEYLSALFECGIDGVYFNAFGAQKEIFIEAGRLSVTVDESDFLSYADADAYLAVDEPTFIPDTIGTKRATLVCEGRELAVFITVRDTVAPSAQPVSGAEYWCGEELEPASFVTELSDATELTLAFADTPECSEPCETQFKILVTDAGGNSTLVTCPVSVKKDDVPPVITGAEDRTVYIGSSVAYKQGVSAIDDRDGEVELSVDISDVVADTPGSYDVIFSAVDACGNETSVTVTFTFTKSQEALIDEELDKLVDQVLSRIITDGMTTIEKAEAIYKWIRANIYYISWVDKSSWKKAAVAGIRTGSGSCYTYYAVSRALLDGVGIPNMMVQKTPMAGRSDHYWNLVNCGSGWYHFDTTPRRANAYFFMWTDAQILEYSNAHYDSHDFDRSLYPATPES